METLQLSFCSCHHFPLIPITNQIAPAEVRLKSVGNSLNVSSYNLSCVAVPRSILKSSFQSILEADETLPLETTTTQTTALTDPISPNAINNSNDIKNKRDPNKNRQPNQNNPRQPPEDYGRSATDRGRQKTSEPPPTRGFSQSPSFPFFNPTVKPPPHNKVKEVGQSIL